MLDWIREHTQGWVVRIILALITIPFALFGIDSYIDHRGAQDAVATVDGTSIARAEFDRAVKQQRVRLVASMGAEAAAHVEDAALRHEVLNGLIRQQVLVNTAYQLGMVVSDQQLAGFIAGIPAFQNNGQFDLQRYQQLLREQGLTVPAFEHMVRDDLLLQGMRASFDDAEQIPQTSVALFIQDFAQQREISRVILPLSSSATNISIAPAQIKAYYDAHGVQFTLPARARFQYVVLSLDDFAKDIQIDPAAVKQAYAQNTAQYTQPEQREARHILIASSAHDSVQKQAAAKALAEHVYQLVVAHPDQFAALAKQYSSDTGSAVQGGNLGWFAHNSMIKPFADRVFSMSSGQISAPVKTDYGYHIIQLTGIHPAKLRSLTDVSKQITQQLQRQQAGTQFADAAERLSNQVFEQSDQLNGAASGLHLPLQTSGWISQHSAEGVLNQPDMLQALFSDDVIKRHHNTNAIEVAPNTLVAARLLALQPAQVQALGSVSAQIVALLRQQQAQAQIAQQGAQLLAQLRVGKEPAGLHWSPFVWVTRTHADGVPSEMIPKIFAADAERLPAYVSDQDAQGNYQVLRVTRVLAGLAQDAAKVQGMTAQLAHMQAHQAFEDYQSSLIAHAKIKVNQQALNPGTQ